MSSRTVVISNDLGLHLRAAGTFVQVASQFEAEIWVERETMRANAKSIMSLLSLAAAKGTSLKITAEGADATEAVDELVSLVERNFET